MRNVITFLAFRRKFILEVNKFTLLVHTYHTSIMKAKLKLLAVSIVLLIRN